MKTFAAAMWRSLRSEERLLEAGDAYALSIRYARRAGVITPSNFMFGLLAFIPLRPSERNLYRYRPWKHLGSVSLIDTCPSLITASDPETGMRLQKDEVAAVELHVDAFAGHHGLLHDLGLAANYMARHERLRAAPMVAGVTYKEMGELALRLTPFRQMQLEEIGERERSAVELSRLAFMRVNGRKQGNKPHPDPIVLYLPTEDFIGAFATDLPASYGPPEPMQ